MLLAIKNTYKNYFQGNYSIKNLVSDFNTCLLNLPNFERATEGFARKLPHPLKYPFHYANHIYKKLEILSGKLSVWLKTWRVRVSFCRDEALGNYELCWELTAPQSFWCLILWPMRLFVAHVNRNNRRLGNDLKLCLNPIIYESVSYRIVTTIYAMPQ